jgi:hypothetical protein
MASRTNPQSLAYRRKAADLAKAAEAEEDAERIANLVKQALAWIQIAENEEALADAEMNTARFPSGSN